MPTLSFGRSAGVALGTICRREPPLHHERQQLRCLGHRPAGNGYEVARHRPGALGRGGRAMRGDTMSWAALELASVSHRYGRRIGAATMSRCRSSGFVSVLLGLNGAGKTTLFLLVARLLSLAGGRDRVFGAPLGRIAEKAWRTAASCSRSRASTSTLRSARACVIRRPPRPVARDASARIDKPS